MYDCDRITFQGEKKQTMGEALDFCAVAVSREQDFDSIAIRMSFNMIRSFQANSCYPLKLAIWNS